MRGVLNYLCAGSNLHCPCSGTLVVAPALQQAVPPQTCTNAGPLYYHIVLQTPVLAISHWRLIVTPFGSPLSTRDGFGTCPRAQST